MAPISVRTKWPTPHFRETAPPPHHRMYRAAHLLGEDGGLCFDKGHPSKAVAPGTWPWVGRLPDL